MWCGMTTLRSWQSALARAIDTSITEDVRAGLPGVGILDVETGCGTYRNSSRTAREAALSDVYPVCRRLLGERSFDGLAREFVRRSPSTMADLNRFGEGFATFVDEVVDLHAEFAGLPWLGELADLEWACHRLHFAADDPPLDLAPLSSQPPESIRPRPAAALAWLHTRWPVHEILLAHGQAGTPGPLRITPIDCYLVIERRDFRATVHVVDGALWQLVDACARGRHLADLASDPGLDAARLGEMVARGWLGGLTG
jgi:hypothetical protein